MRRVITMLTVAAMLAAMGMVAGPASAQGGCQAFGQHIVSDVQASPPAGQFVRTLAPLNDDALSEQAAFCQ
jgi:hypothetical protein